MNHKNERSSCSTIVALFLMALAIFGLWHFLSKPDALEEVAKLLAGVAGCTGIAILAILLIFPVQSLPGEPSVEPVESAAAPRTKVTMRRTKPDFDSEEAYSSIRVGLFVGIISAVFAVFCVGGFIEGFGETHFGWICLGPLVILVMVLQAGLGFKVALDGAVVLLRKRQWLRVSESAPATIVHRSCDYEVDYEGYAHHTYELILRIDTEGAETGLDELLAGAYVSKRIYRKYAYVGSRSRINYSPEAPQTFLIKGE